MKKRVVFICVILSLVVPFAWTGGQSDSQAATEEPATLVWYLPGSHSSYPYNPDEEKLVYEKASEITKEAFNAVLDVRVLGSYGDYNKKMPIIMASGEEFDLAWASSWSNDFYKAAHDGMFAPLEDLLKEYATTAYKNNLVGAPDLTVKGNLYGVSAQAVAAKGTRVRVRKDLIDKYGWDLSNLKSILDLEPMLKEIVKNEPGVYPINTEKGTISWLSGAMKYVSVGFLSEVVSVKYDDPDMKVLNKYEQEDYKETLALLREWYKQGIIPSDAITMKTDQKKALENNGKIGIVLHSSYDPVNTVHIRGEYEYNDFLMGEAYIKPGAAIGTVQTISFNSKNKEKAARLLELIATDSDFYNLIAYGMEGRNYEKLEPNRIKFKKDGGYAQDIGWIYGLQWYGYLMENDNPKRNEIWKNFNESAYTPYILGFVADLDSIKTQIANCSSLVQQYQLPIDVGAVDADMLDKFNSELKKAGIDEIIAELQSQIDTWAKSK